ncbi:hypothetical protein [Legionella spiritensis]|uniref:hypothetical protein n=1 Tax=Legionella spiritensis TaxID=452 RepID=UPI000F6E60C4|nr:hypothetical protein [Legionella spiritensis]VEG91213.1 Uncharacterised protein [Legionella spiritensis]
MLYNLIALALHHPLVKYTTIAIVIFCLTYWGINFFNLKNTEGEDCKKFRIKFASTIAIAITSLIIAYSQLEQIQREISSNTFNTMNAWYNDLYKEFPNTFSNKDTKIKKRNLARRYFNLWQNEFIHCRKNSMDKDFMDIINHGACKNMILYHDLIEQYDFWIKNNAFHHSKILKMQISIVVDYAKKKKCEKIPKTKNCLIKKKH